MANLTPKQSVLFSLCLFQIIGIFLYLPGFLPIPSLSLHNKESFVSISHVFSGENHSSSKNETAKFDRLILMVIDALREDFVFTTDSRMPFLQKLINMNHSMSFTSITKPPTVTLPRIKALVSGSIAGFIDVALNFASTEMTDDNLIAQLTLNNRNVIFYGDDTWMKLFPKSFHRCEGTTSFFVSDYVEVDNNVTRHLPEELKANDWDMMILHYLGLDHIGHLAGPKSPLVPNKLLEMDNIIKTIYESTTITDGKQGIKTLILVTGDHGMADGGSHGGASHAEIRSPAVFISPGFEVNGQGQAYNDEVINQVDIPPTLAMLFGLGVPQKSIGAVVPYFWLDSTPSEKLKIINKNGCQLLSAAQHWTNDINLLKRLEDFCFLSSFNITSSTNANATLQFLAIASEMQSIVKLLQDQSGSHNYLLIISGITILGCCLLLTFYNLNMVLPLHILDKYDGNYLVFILNIFLWFGSIVQPFLLFSTSLIEEEHQTWYFMVLTLLLLISFLSFTTQTNTTIYKSCKQSTEHKSLSYSRYFQHFILLVLFRLIISWNQSGVKFIGNKDLGDILREPSNIHWLTILSVISLSIQTALNCYDSYDKSNCVLFSLGLILVYLYQSTTNNLFNFSCLVSNNKGLTESRCVILLVIILVIKGVKDWSDGKDLKFVDGLIAGGTLMVNLLARVHNITWLTLVLVFLFIYKRIAAPRLITVTGSYAFVYLSYIWLGKALFYAQGNSISFATIDVSAAFVGMSDVNMIIAALFILLSTYTGHVLAFFGLLSFLRDHKHSIYDPILLLIWLASSCLEVTLFTIQCFAQRFHLFIWSVFAPKLVYVLVSSTLTSMFIAIIIIMHMFTNKFKHWKIL